jgi:hypothetical protein
MRCIITILASAAIIVSAACAQQLISPGQEEVARSLVRYAFFRPGYIQGLTDVGLTAAEPEISDLFTLIAKAGGPMTSAERDAVRQALRRVVEEALTSREFEDTAVRIYAAHFTEPEMREILRFYRTPAGEKTLQEQPKMTAEFQAAGTRLMTSASTKRRMLEEVRAALPTRRLPE